MGWCSILIKISRNGNDLKAWELQLFSKISNNQRLLNIIYTTKNIPMIKLICAFTLTLFAYSATFAQVTMDQFKKQFEGKSIAEVKTILVEQNKQLESMLKLSSMRIKITAGSVDPKESKTTEKFSTSPKEKIAKAFSEKLEKLYFRQHIVYPNTVLGIDFSTSSLMYTVQDYDDYEFPKPTLKLKQVYFKDGKTLKLNQNIVGRDGDMADEIKGTKWIDSVQLEASYYYPDQLSFVNVSAKNPTQILDGGKINLVEIKANEVDLQISTTLKDQIIKVEGINSSGKAVEQSGSSSSSMSGNFSETFLTSLYTAGQDVITKIDANKYKNVDELVKDLYQNMPKEDQEKPEKLTNASYSFRGNITAVNIFFKPKGAVETYTFTLKNQAEYIDGFTIAENKKELIGLLDENGKWVVEPTFERLDYYKTNYFMGDVGADGYQAILWLDKANKKLVPFKYRFYHNELYFDKYYSIENGVNGPKGLVNAITNKIEIEPTNDNIYSRDNYIVVNTTEKRSRILDKDLKEILSLNNQSYNIKGDFIFVDKPYKSKDKFADYITLSNTEEIYNKLGQKINKEDLVADSYDFFGVDNLLLVQNKAGKKFFINTKGDMALDASKYANVKYFSNGLAAVKNQAGKWGYMNTKGETVIPFIYEDAQTFSKISAMVQVQNGYLLIDRNNKTIKKFAQGFSSYRTSKDTDALEYTNYDGRRYGSNGEVIVK